MSDDRERRIDDALSSLVDALIPRRHTDDDDDISDNRHENALDFVKGIIDSQVAPAVISDVNHASDLIKKKLIRNSPSPDKALRFSNLYARLLTQPVLSQKWAILHLLYQLADSNAPERYARASPSPSFTQEAPQSNLEAAPPLVGSSLLNSRTGRVTGDGGAFVDAFSQMGLHKLPDHGGSRWSRGEVNVAFGPLGESGKERSSSVMTKMGLLAQNHPPLNPPEASLLRDLPFTLQGLSSTNLPFASISSLMLPPTLPFPIISLLHTLAEPSLLYRGLSAFAQSVEGGLVGQSLRAALGEELRAYLGLVAALEGEIRCALAMAEVNEPRGGIGKAAVTLKRCVVWTREATMGLRLMSLMVEKSKSKKGGQLISMIHGFSSSHGDPFVGAFAERLLMHVTRPFYDMLRQWIYDGELSDPHFEFFVLEQHSNIDTETNGDGRARGGATSVWEYKYRLDEEMIPSIITKDFAKKVFLIGKSLNFIRYGCGDSAWVEGYSKAASKELRYGDTATLETSIDEAYKATMARLIHLMADKFKLFEHLKALKKYLLLGQGDFIALLMENLSSNLDRPANTLYRHNLTAQLEHAIRGSNAQFDSPDVLRRLDARMLELSHGEIGWDVFTLEYKIDAPVDVIVTPYGSRQYLKVFNFLWRVKRVEFALGSTWRRYMTGARGVLASVADKVGADWKIARCCVAEMIHFVCQLQYYILFEVIESSWDTLQVAMGKPECTLDDLIEEHARYLQAITHKGLLGNARAGGNTSKEEGFLAQLHEILKIMLAYKDAVDGLYSFSVAEFTRRQEATAKIETRTAQGKWGITEQDEEELSSPSSAAMGRGGGRGQGSESLNSTPFSGANNFGIGLGEDQMLPSLRQRLKHLSSDFRARVNILLGDLAYQPDVDMRFLGVVMNFNDVYNPIRRKMHKSGQRDKKSKAGGSSGVSKDSAA
ncbi:MAG: Microtubule-nucleating Tub4p (gamma-tubulin) complex component [Geoglossum simile]|nr:MAG: Microtubule-nucleating Tub4p (gamma-tubulin) complex component [Geoglossum simile]